MDDRSWRFIKPRKQLAASLAEKGITDTRIIQAIAEIPRHLFIDESFEHLSYEDRPLPIGYEQTISQPFTVAYQTQLLEVKPGDKILEIGTGSGYQAAVLKVLGAKVYTVERIKGLYEETKERLERLGYTPDYIAHADGTEGLPAFAPYDGIIVTAAAEEIPPALLKQLKPGGKLVIPVGKGSQRMLRIIKRPDGSPVKEIYDRFQFVPLLKGKIS